MCNLPQTGSASVRSLTCANHPSTVFSPSSDFVLVACFTILARSPDSQYVVVRHTNRLSALRKTSKSVRTHGCLSHLRSRTWEVSATVYRLLGTEKEKSIHTLARHGTLAETQGERAPGTLLPGTVAFSPSTRPWNSQVAPQASHVGPHSGSVASGTCTRWSNSIHLRIVLGTYNRNGSILRACTTCVIQILYSAWDRFLGKELDGENFGGAGQEALLTRKLRKR